MRIPDPPVTDNPALNRWMRDVQRLLDTQLRLVTDQLQQKGLDLYVAVRPASALPDAAESYFGPPINAPTGQTGVTKIVMVPDEASGATLAFSDGANWLRVQDLAVVS